MYTARVLQSFHYYIASQPICITQNLSFTCENNIRSKKIALFSTY